ncbi:MAG: hypothetical protein M3O41_06815 [Pseudomonadota bacterium]|nr:hypothetical protein [Pseudomonadota bacterium]
MEAVVLTGVVKSYRLGAIEVHAVRSVDLIVRGNCFKSSLARPAAARRRCSI